MTYLEHPISLASHWCCTNSCREASLLGGELEYWGLMVEAMALLMYDEADPWEEAKLLSNEVRASRDSRCGFLTWKTL